MNLILARYTAPGPCHRLSLNPDHKQPCVLLQNELQTPINQLIIHLRAHYGRTSRAAECCSRMVGRGVGVVRALPWWLMLGRHSSQALQVPGGTPGSKRGKLRNAGFHSQSRLLEKMFRLTGASLGCSICWMYDLGAMTCLLRASISTSVQ